jgi:cysteinyl-tRNA synthetase
MDDDFNTPRALAALFDLERALQTSRAESGAAAIAPGLTVLRRLGGVLGLFTGASAELPAELRSEVERLLRARDEARRRRLWAEADAARAQLVALGVTVEDTPTGTQWTWNPRAATP